MRESRLSALKAALVVVGLIFVFGIYPLMRIWPSGWQWIPPQPEYEQMIVGVYAVLGIFLLVASREPAKHRLLIAFTAWSSLVHGAIMAVQALLDPRDSGHFAGDVPALLLVGVVLLALMPAARTRALSD